MGDVGLKSNRRHIGEVMGEHFQAALLRQTAHHDCVQAVSHIALYASYPLFLPAGKEKGR
jgi:hypothetical protein